MTTHTWPATRVFMPQQQELRVVDNTQRTAESSLSGYVQTSGMPGARWAWGLDMAPDSAAERAALEAFLLRLSGRQHRVQLWDMRNPRPRGNVALSTVTLGAAAAQFATSVTLAGCATRTGQVFASFEADTNADGLANDLTAYSSGTTGAVTYMRSVSPLVDGAYSQTVNAGGVGTSSTDRAGFQITMPGVLSGASQSITASVYARGTVGVRATILMEALNSAGTVVDSTSGTITMSLTYAAVSCTSLLPSGAVSVRLTCYLGDSTVGVVAAFADFDALLMNVGTSRATVEGAATLLAGDWLGLTGGQLVRVVADATATDAGAMTVEVRHMLRAAVASGTAVTLDKPAALYVRTEAGIALPRMPGNVDPGLSLDLVEVFE